MIKIRDAVLADAKSIAALHAASWQNTYAGELRADYLAEKVPAERQALWQQRMSTPRVGQHVLIALDAEVLLGFVCFFIDEHAESGTYLENLHVSAQAQGRGVGEKLMRQAAAICAEQAISQKLYLLVNQSNLQAQKFYLKLGAVNAATAVWNAPDGSAVPTFRFVWESVRALANRVEP